MLVDSVFGGIEFDTMWQKKEDYFFCEKDFEITLFIQGSKNQPPTKLQKDTYIAFNNKKIFLMSEIERKIFEFYQTVCDEYRDMYGEDADSYIPVAEKTCELRGFVKPQSIMIPSLTDNRIINILFKTKWDLEMGIGIRIVNEEIDIVGVQSDVL